MRRRTLVAAPLAAWLAAAAPAGSGTIDPALVEAANKEGEVVWYTTLIVGQAVRPLVAAFQAAYPKIKISFVPGPPVETATRLLNEAKAGSVRADVFDGGSTFFPLNQAGLVDTYSPTGAAGWPDAYRDIQGKWVATNLYILSPAVNTELVQPNEIPKTLDDLLDPRWTGKMAWPDTPSASGPPGFIGNVLLSMGQERGMAYLQKLAAQRIANVPAVQRVVLDQCISGQYPLVLSIYNNHAWISIEQGAPVKWLPIEPLVLTFGTTGLLKNSPHPQAGKLLIEFLVSEAGQRVFRDAGYLPANPAVPPRSPELVPGRDGPRTTVISPATYAEHEAEWLSIENRLFH